jgi:hypothetical protein
MFVINCYLMVTTANVYKINRLIYLFIMKIKIVRMRTKFIFILNKFCRNIVLSFIC